MARYGFKDLYSGMNRIGSKFKGSSAYQSIGQKVDDAKQRAKSWVRQAGWVKPLDGFINAVAPDMIRDLEGKARDALGDELVDDAKGIYNEVIRGAEPTSRVGATPASNPSIRRAGGNAGGGGSRSKTVNTMNLRRGMV